MFYVKVILNLHKNNKLLIRTSQLHLLEPWITLVPKSKTKKCVNPAPPPHADLYDVLYDPPST
jgi:hypothetical protein